MLARVLGSLGCCRVGAVRRGLRMPKLLPTAAVLGRGVAACPPSTSPACCAGASVRLFSTVLAGRTGASPLSLGLAEGLWRLQSAATLVSAVQ